jgi:nucleoside 2-deoxyribosyltransferase
LKIYFAGPLFSEAERDWISKAKQQIEAHAINHTTPISVCWPYELLTKDEIDSLGERAKYEVFIRCRSNLEDADVVIALLDSPQVDDGTAWEIGYFYRTKTDKQKIIGIRTDFRRAGESEGAKVNATIECSCDESLWVRLRSF